MKKIYLYLLILLSCISLGFSYGTPVINYTYDSSSVSGTTLTNFGSAGDGSILGNPAFLTGFENEYISFDGTDDAINTNYVVPNSADTYIGASFWFKFTDAGTGQFYSSYYDSTQGQVYSQFGYNGSGSVNIGFRDSSGNTYKAESSPGYNDGEWHHLAGTIDPVNDVIYLYVDNQLVATATGANTGNYYDAGSKTIRIAQNACCGTTEYPFDMENFNLFLEELDSSEVDTLFSAGDAILNPAPSLNITFNNPQDNEVFGVDTNEITLNISTDINVTTCDYDGNVLNSDDGGYTWYDNYTLNVATEQQQTYNLNISCLNPYTSEYESKELTFFKNGTGNLTLDVIVPVNEFNYTFDVETLDFEMNADMNGYESGLSCEFEYEFNTYPMFTNDSGLTWYYENFSLGTPVNETLVYDTIFTCSHDTYSVAEIEEVTFYKQAEPLEFDIFIPQDEQVFNPETEQIEFHMETNYVSFCEHKTTNSTEFVPFDYTNDSVHYTNFSVIPEINTYESTFRCYAQYVNTTQEFNLTFYIDELPIKGGLKATQDLAEESFSVIDFIFGAVANLFINNLSVMIVAISMIGFFVVLIGGVGYLAKRKIE